MIDDSVSVEGIYAFIYCTKWKSGRVSRMPDRLTTLKDRNTQLLIKFKTGALVTQQLIVEIKSLLKPPFLLSQELAIKKAEMVDRLLPPPLSR